LQKRIALVTGVSRIKGIGRAICVDLASKGIDIFFTYWKPYDQMMPWSVNEDEPEQIEAEIKQLGVQCFSKELDLSDVNNIPQLFKDAIDHIGTPNILINNATYSANSNIYDLSSQDLDRHYQLNVKATALLISEFLKLENADFGRIINLTSGQSLGPMPHELAYAMTKSAIETLTTTIASQIAAKGVTINAVNPGPTDTGWMTDELELGLKKHFPTGRIGLPSDISKLITYLVSEEAAWITGQIIHSEGGFKRQMI